MPGIGPTITWTAGFCAFMVGDEAYPDGEVLVVTTDLRLCGDVVNDGVSVKCIG